MELETIDSLKHSEYSCLLLQVFRHLFLLKSEKLGERMLLKCSVLSLLNHLHHRKIWKIIYASSEYTGLLSIYQNVNTLRFRMKPCMWQGI